eukprot:2789045-Amphidinium_carterae.1
MLVHGRHCALPVLCFYLCSLALRQWQLIKWACALKGPSPPGSALAETYGTQLLYIIKKHPCCNKCPTTTFLVFTLGAQVKDNPCKGC